MWRRMAWRNLWRNRRRTLLTLCAIGLGQVVLIAMVSFTTGFADMMVEQVARSGMGHIQLHQKDYLQKKRIDLVVPGATSVLDTVRRVPGVVAATPRLLLTGAIRSSTSSAVQVVQVVAADRDAEAPFSAVAGKIVGGGFLLPPKGAVDPNAPLRLRARKGITLGKKLAEQLHVHLGSKVRLDTSGFRGANVANAFYVTGIFSTGTDIFDRQTVVLGLEDMQEATGAGDTVHEIAVRIARGERIETVVGRIETAIAASGLAGVSVVPWWEVHPEVRQMVDMMKSFNGLMGLFMLVILSAGILTTMYMVVYERQHEFGVQMALGTRPARLFFSIMVEAGWMAAIAAMGGLVLAAFVVWYLAVYGVDLSVFGEGFDVQGLYVDNVYKGSTAPEVFIGPTVVVVAGTLFFSLWPALKVARMKVVDAMRDGLGR